MKIGNWTKPLLAGLMLLIAVYFLWWIFYTPDFVTWHSMNAPARASLIQLQQDIKVGDSYESVLKTYWQHSLHSLVLEPRRRDLWSVSMPHEIFATDWVMYIEFVDGKVSAVRVRSSDGPRPAAAPEDKGG
jgi:hypothetical protein